MVAVALFMVAVAVVMVAVAVFMVAVVLLMVAIALFIVAVVLLMVAVAVFMVAVVLLMVAVVLFVVAVAVLMVAVSSFLAAARKENISASCQQRPGLLIVGRDDAWGAAPSEKSVAFCTSSTGSYSLSSLGAGIAPFPPPPLPPSNW